MPVNEPYVYIAILYVTPLEHDKQKPRIALLGYIV